MKAVIIAAGKGSRLGAFTQNLPKCLAVVADGESLFERQLEAFRQCGISDFVVIRGYQGHQFTHPDIRYYWNYDFESGNILDSLMCAEGELDGDVLVSYSDIWFEPSVPKVLLQSKADIVLAVDIDWKKHYENRELHPVTEAEAVLFDGERKVLKIGKIAISEPAVQGEFIGMMKMSKRGSEIFRQYHEKAKKRFDGRPFQRASLFKRAYLTDMLQYLTESGVPVYCEAIQGGWHEIDTPEDLKNWLKIIKKAKVIMESRGVEREENL